MKEAQIEERLRKGGLKLGGIFYKFTSPQRRSVPDRMGVFPTALTVFVECKATGKEPTPAQEREMARLKALGFWVEGVDSYETVDDLLSRVAREIVFRGL